MQISYNVVPIGEFADFWNRPRGAKFYQVEGSFFCYESVIFLSKW